MNSDEHRKYAYVGPPEIKAKAEKDVNCCLIESRDELASWVGLFLPQGHQAGEVVATFIVDLAGTLWLADRCSEHVACADGRDVLAAGELVINLENRRGIVLVEVVDTSNQSTGYCPEPECWAALEMALDALGVAHPGKFTAPFQFRRCESCGSIQLVKDEVYECAECGSVLNREWNFTKA